MFNCALWLQKEILILCPLRYTNPPLLLLLDKKINIHSMLLFWGLSEITCFFSFPCILFSFFFFFVDPLLTWEVVHFKASRNRRKKNNRDFLLTHPASEWRFQTNFALSIEALLLFLPTKYFFISKLIPTFFLTIWRWSSALVRSWQSNH